MTDIRAFLGEHLRRFGASPFLFVGSGISRRYLGLEDWETLLRRFAALTEKPYEYYRATADGSLPAIGSALAREFHNVWWFADGNAASRNEHSAECVKQDSALKIEIARHLRGRSSQIVEDEKLRQELECLSRAVIDGIITTNWDTLLDELFDEFEVFTGQDKLIFSSTQGVGEIYKIHGSCSEPNSLVLTAEDYERFDERNPYLAAKLLTTFVEHPVIFLGYSLSDPNVARVLRAIASCLTTQTISQLRDRLIFVQWDEGKVEVNTGANFVLGGFSLPVVTISTNDFLPIYQALAEGQRRFPAKLLRRLKKHVYDLVLNKNPRGSLQVVDLDSEADFTQVRVVFGVGATLATGTTGYRAISRAEVIKDAVFEDGGFDCEKVVKDTLPQLLKGTRYVPVFRYLKGAGYLDASGVLTRDGLDPRVIRAARAELKRFAPPQWNQRKTVQVRALGQDFVQYAATHSPHEVVHFAPLLPQEALEPSALLTFIKANWAMLGQENVDAVQFAKLVCIHDFLVNGPRS